MFKYPTFGTSKVWFYDYFYENLIISLKLISKKFHQSLKFKYSTQKLFLYNSDFGNYFQISNCRINQHQFPKPPKSEWKINNSSRFRTTFAAFHHRGVFDKLSTYVTEFCNENNSQFLNPNYFSQKISSYILDKYQDTYRDTLLS